MKIKINSKELLRVLSICEKAIDRNAVIPCMAHVLVKAVGSKITCVATNLNIIISTSVEASVVEEGECTVDIVLAMPTLKGLPDLDVVITSESGSMTIVNGKSSYKMAAYDPKDFPNVNQTQSEPFFVQSDFVDIFSKCATVAGTDEMRPAMMGVHIGPRYMVATDANCLISNELELECLLGITVPATLSRSLHFLRKDEPLSISESDNIFNIADSLTCISIRKIDARYPQWQSVIPMDYEVKAAIDKSVLVGCLEMLAKYSNNETRAAILNFTETTLNVVCYDIDKSNEANETHSVTCDKPLKIGVNALNLAKVLRQVTGETVIFEMTAANKAIVVKDATDSKFKALVMPIIINQ